MVALFTTSPTVKSRPAKYIFAFAFCIPLEILPVTNLDLLTTTSKSFNSFANKSTVLPFPRFKLPVVSENTLSHAPSSILTPNPYARFVSPATSIIKSPLLTKDGFIVASPPKTVRFSTFFIFIVPVFTIVPATLIDVFAASIVIWVPLFSILPELLSATSPPLFPVTVIFIAPPLF